MFPAPAIVEREGKPFKPTSADVKVERKPFSLEQGTMPTDVKSHLKLISPT